MSAFEFISVALSFVLGLGIARLLTSAVNVFRWRSSLELHWVPLAWAAGIFLYQLQYWWAIFELNGMIETWTLMHFGALLGLAILLFVAGTLVLPMSEPKEGDTLLTVFDRDGRWALICLSGYAALGLWVNWYLFEVSPFDYLGALMGMMLITPLVFLTMRNQRAKNVVTVVYIVLGIWVVLEASPASYT